MTKNEVDLHTNEAGKTGIIIVSGIEIGNDDGGKITAVGGKLYIEIGWDIKNWDCVPMAYRVVRTKGHQSG
jgi:hypothetical protein